MSTTRRSILTLLAISTGVLSATTSSPVGTRVPNFRIEDQFEHEWTRQTFNGMTTVYVLSDRSGYTYNANWTDTLIPRFKNAPVRFVPVADVQSVPGFLKGFIRSRFRDQFKYPVLMDWDGILVKAFQMQEGYTNLVIVDRQGYVRHTAFGVGTGEQVDAFIKNLESILAH